ncbi:hypothetical protein OC846_000938 [Tilletia horrida]|uniref:Uncharacterized protein n=1 Tax=Tilletia horrida TaxID=155126 RepID=A0AAN6GUW5_9BASI|nr:hypothetical protein OC845_000848 [Tilletia horrida]KAK0556750.1 hypothetical protein OC846_000938 [Tilletia horrida]
MAHPQSGLPPGTEPPGACTAISTVALVDTTVQSQKHARQEVQETAVSSAADLPQLRLTLSTHTPNLLAIANGLVAALSSDEEGEGDKQLPEAEPADRGAQIPATETEASTSATAQANAQQSAWEGGLDRLIRVHPDDEAVPASIIDTMPEKISPRVAVETYSALCRHLEPEYWRAVTTYAQNLPDHSKAGMEALSRFAEVLYIRAHGVYTMMCSRYDNHLRHWATANAAQSLTKKDLESSRRQLRRRKQHDASPLKPHPPTVFVTPASPKPAESSIEQESPNLITDDQRFTARVNISRKKSAKTKQKGATGNRSLLLHASEQIAKGVFNDATRPDGPGKTTSSSRRKALPAEHTMIVQALNHANATRELSYEHDLFADSDGPHISFLSASPKTLSLHNTSATPQQGILGQNVGISAPQLSLSVSQCANPDDTNQPAATPEETTNKTTPAVTQAGSPTTTKSKGKKTTAAAPAKKNKTPAKAPAKAKAAAKTKTTATASKTKGKANTSAAAKNGKASTVRKANSDKESFGAPVVLSSAAPRPRQSLLTSALTYPNLSYSSWTSEARDHGNGQGDMSWMRSSTSSELAQSNNMLGASEAGYYSAQYTPRMVPDTSSRHVPSFSMAGVAFPWVNRDPSEFAGQSFFSRPFTQESTSSGLASAPASESTAVWPQVPHGIFLSRMAVIHGLPYELVATDPFRIYVLILHLLRQLNLSSLSHTVRLISTLSSIPIPSPTGSQSNSNDETVNGTVSSSSLVPAVTHNRRGWAWIIFNSAQHRNSFLQTYAQKTRAGWLPPALDIAPTSAADHPTGSRSAYLIYSAETYLGVPNTSQQAATESQRPGRVSHVQHSLVPAATTQNQAFTVTLPLVPLSTSSTNGDGSFQSYSQMVSNSGNSVAGNWAATPATRLTMTPYLAGVPMPPYSSLPPSLIQSTPNPINTAAAAAMKRKREDSANTMRSMNAMQPFTSVVPWQNGAYTVAPGPEQKRKRVPTTHTATFVLRPTRASPAVASNTSFASTSLPQVVPHTYQFGSHAGVHPAGSASFASQQAPSLALSSHMRAGSVENSWASPSILPHSSTIASGPNIQQQGMWTPSGGVTPASEQFDVMDARMSVPPTYALQETDAGSSSIGNGSHIQLGPRHALVGSEAGNGSVHSRLRNLSTSTFISNSNGTGSEYGSWRPATAAAFVPQGNSYAPGQNTNTLPATDAAISSFYPSSMSGASSALQNASQYGNTVHDQRFASSHETSAVRMLHNGSQLYESRPVTASTGHVHTADGGIPAGRAHDNASSGNTVGSFVPVESRLPDSYMRSTLTADQLYSNASGGGGNSGRDHNSNLLSNCASFGGAENQANGASDNVGAGSGAELSGPGEVSVGSTASF